MAIKPEEIKYIEERLENLTQKEKKIKGTHVSKDPFVYAAAVGFRVAIELISGVLIGAGIGYVLDGFFNTRPIFLATLLLLGGGAGFLNVYMFAKAEEKKKK